MSDTGVPDIVTAEMVQAAYDEMKVCMKRFKRLEYHYKKQNNAFDPKSLERKRECMRKYAAEHREELNQKKKEKYYANKAKVAELKEQVAKLSQLVL